MFRFIQLEEGDDGVAVLTLNRPEALNAWHRPMRQEIAAALSALNAKPAVRDAVRIAAYARARETVVPGLNAAGCAGAITGVAPMLAALLASSPRRR
ncbi:MAG: hypothetical protein HY521_07900 [Proteobacteria bacterium]|nr:hypothetical protein [Pseudomonadota bacterium]